MLERDEAIQLLNEAYKAYCKAVKDSAEASIVRDLPVREAIAFYRRELEIYQQVKKRVLEAGHTPVLAVRNDVYCFV